MLLANRYQLIERVGVGGSASVYRAHDTQIGDIAAVKVIHPNLIQDPDLLDRFIRESALLMELDHPSIPSLRSRSALDDELHWFAIDFVDGDSLSKRAGEGMSAVDLTVFGIEVCDALHYLHTNGVVHRDVKPDNILIDATDCARLVDFGIAQVSSSPVTQVGAVMGTPTFMPPEQAIDPRNATPRADVYSLGVTLFAVATRRSGIELTYPSTRREALAALPRMLSAVVDRATHLEPDDRYPDAETMQWALAEAMDAG